MQNVNNAQCETTIDKCLTEALTSYSSPLLEAVKAALACEHDTLKKIASESVSELVNSEEFKVTMKQEMKRKLARVLISQYGGEIEKTVAKLKSDPTTRAKLTVAIDDLMNSLIN